MNAICQSSIELKPLKHYALKYSIPVITRCEKIQGRFSLEFGTVLNFLSLTSDKCESDK